MVHNLAVALYSLEPGEEGEAALLRYLARAGRASYGTAVQPLYDPQYALRLAQECSKPRAAVRLMCQLGEWTDAPVTGLWAVGATTERQSSGNCTLLCPVLLYRTG